jgi:transcriptional regulator with XRE-family HTH domain
MEFSRTLLEFRAKHNLTQKKLGEILGIALNAVHRYEANKNKPSAMHKIQFETKMREWEENKNESL